MRSILLALIVWLASGPSFAGEGKVLPPSAETGVASWYGYPYHGRYAADGEIYDMEKLTAAHRTLPFGTWVRVKNLNNARSVKVRITDRGPFIEGRIIDLSRAAARSIGLMSPGIGPVRVEVVELPLGAGPGRFAVQVGAFQVRGNAERYAALMRLWYGSGRIALSDGAPPLWRVLVGCEATEEAARELAERLRVEDPGRGVFTVRLDP
jgi:rare lipoprotein A